MLTRDGEVLWTWEVDGAEIVGPERFAGLSLKRPFADWIARNLSPDEAEAAIVLRRGIFISNGRRDLDQFDRVPMPVGGCITLQPGRIENTFRMKGSSLDFTDRPQALTEDDQDWLAFAGD